MHELHAVENRDTTFSRYRGLKGTYLKGYVVYLQLPAHSLILKTEHLERRIKRSMRGLEREEQDSGEGNYLIPSPIISRRGASCLLPRSGVRPSMSRDLSK